MTWQRGTRVLSSSLLLLILLQVTNSVPQNFAYYTHYLPQQQIIPQQQLVPQTSRVVVLPPGAANLPSLQQYAAAGTPLGSQYVLLQREEKPETPEKPGDTTEKPSQPGLGEWVLSFLPSLPNVPFINPAPTPPVSNPEKPATDSNKPAEAGTPAKLEELEPASPAMPAAPGVPAVAPINPFLPDSAAASPDQRFILGQPQFFGNYDGLKRLGVKNLGNKGVIPNFLLVRGQPGGPHLGGKPEPEKLQASDRPGSAALGFMRYLDQQKQALNDASAASQDFQLYLDQQRQSEGGDQGAVVVNADRRGVGKGEEGDGANEDGENVEATNPHGPSVAQVKPQAIALAGPGGVAAAAPVGTALVGPGGLAVAAPSATAVAGPSGGAPPVVAPAQRVLAAYLRAHANQGYVALTP